MKKIKYITIILMALCLANAVYAQTAPPYPSGPTVASNITKLRISFDNEPSFDLETDVSITSSGDVSFSDNISLPALSLGNHRLLVRVKDADGKWSATEFSTTFTNLLPTYPTPPPPASNITQLGWFIDSDLGFDAETPIAVTPANEVSFSGNINLPTLSAGNHRLLVRVKDADGKWSATEFSTTFTNLLPTYPTPPPPASNITQLGWFIDSDPGFDAETPIAVTPANEVNFSGNINFPILPQGVHRLFLRSRDADGKWGLVADAQFDNAVFAYPQPPSSASNLQQLEVVIDNDNGYGSGQIVTLPALTDVSDQNIVVNLPGNFVNGTTHQILVRVKQNPWSMTESVSFLAGTVLPLQLISFDATQSETQVHLFWRVTDEKNVDSYLVERSADGKFFTQIGSVKANNAQNGNTEYHFNDNEPLRDNNYYRLKMMDTDGSFTYSPIRVVIFSAKNTPNVFPTPASDALVVLNADESSLDLMTLSGQVVLSQKSGSNYHRLSVGDLPSGMYVLKIKQKNGQTHAVKCQIIH